MQPGHGESTPVDRSRVAEGLHEALATMARSVLWAVVIAALSSRSVQRRTYL
jgi:hypothetical protein